MTVRLNEVDKVEILTLQDNYIDIAATTARPSCSGRRRKMPPATG